MIKFNKGAKRLDFIEEYNDVELKEYFSSTLEASQGVTTVKELGEVATHLGLALTTFGSKYEVKDQMGAVMLTIDVLALCRDLLHAPSEFEDCLGAESLKNFKENFEDISKVFWG